MATSTLEELVLYMYNESDNHRQREIEQELQENWVLKEKYNVIKESAERLNRMKLQTPRKQTIDAIMDYASCTSGISSR
jgi:hypothetical protein